MDQDLPHPAGAVTLITTAAYIRAAAETSPAYLVFREGPFAPLSCTIASQVERHELLRGWIGAVAAEPLRDLATAPRDGTPVFVFERDVDAVGWGEEARVVPTWVTDAFIPASIAADDVTGMNHGAIPDESIAGWLPLPDGLAGTTDIVELRRRLPPDPARPPVARASGTTTDANADLMAPIAEILNGSDKDLPTKVGVLVDLAAALLVTDARFRDPRELRLTAEEFRKRMIRAARLAQAAFDARQENAMAELKARFGDAAVAVLPQEKRPAKSAPAA